MNKLIRGFTTTAAFALSAGMPVSWAQDEFSELNVLIEINASDGDAGFHSKHDGDPWKVVKMSAPNGKKIFDERAKGILREQGLTENFFESAEPPCEADPEEPGARTVTLAEFIDRFPDGVYTFHGKSINGDVMTGEATLTYDLPAAPDVSLGAYTGDADVTVYDGATDVDPEDAVIGWAGGDDLGDSCHDQALIDDGTITDHETVAVVSWEVTVEPDVDALPGPKRVFNIQLPVGQYSVTVPAAYLEAYEDEGVTEFKFEVGAIEASANRTFTEGTFELEDE